jgi:hypothetical protein
MVALLPFPSCLELAATSLPLATPASASMNMCTCLSTHTHVSKHADAGTLASDVILLCYAVEIPVTVVEPDSGQRPIFSVLDQKP